MPITPISPNTALSVQAYIRGLEAELSEMEQTLQSTQLDLGTAKGLLHDFLFAFHLRNTCDCLALAVSDRPCLACRTRALLCLSKDR